MSRFGALAGSAMMVAAVIGVPATAHADDADHGSGDRVRCNEQALKKAIKKANDGGGGTLSLAHRCTYTITTPDNEGNALPVITSKITIHGNGSTIQRSSTADFRIFQIGIFQYDALGPGGDLTLDHVTIRNGHAVFRSFIDPGLGGGLHLASSRAKLTLTRSKVVDNSAEQSGGGIQNTFGTVVARNSVISRNHAANGGGYSGFGFSGIAGSGDLTILDSSITDNSAEPFFGGAGGIATGGGTSVIRNSVIRGNRAGHGGGIVYGGGGPDVTLTIRHSAISDNSADHDAGGIFIESGFITFNDSKITRNVAGDLGGGILATNENEGGETSVTLNDTSVSDNKTVGTNLPLEAGGGIYSHNAGLHLNRSRVYSNSTTGANSVAGGIFAEFGSSLTLRDSSVSNNSSKQPPGGIYVKDSTVALTDSRVINNRPTNCSGSPIPVPGCVD